MRSFGVIAKRVRPTLSVRPTNSASYGRMFNVGDSVVSFIPKRSVPFVALIAASFVITWVSVDFGTAGLAAVGLTFITCATFVARPSLSDAGVVATDEPNQQI